MTLKLTDKQILDYKKDGVILIKKAFLPWIEKLSKGFQKVLNEPSSHGRENVSKQKNPGHVMNMADCFQYYNPVILDYIASRIK